MGSHNYCFAKPYVIEQPIFGVIIKHEQCAIVLFCHSLSQ
jgi:hypothetical protein